MSYFFFNREAAQTRSVLCIHHRINTHLANVVFYFPTLYGTPHCLLSEKGKKREKKSCIFFLLFELYMIKLNIQKRPQSENPKNCLDPEVCVPNNYNILQSSNMLQEVH